MELYHLDEMEELSDHDLMEIDHAAQQLAENRLGEKEDSEVD